MRSNIQQTIELYHQASWKKLFAKIRFWDAPYIEVEKMVPTDGKIIDLGCGEGIFSNFLAISGPKRQIYGVDVDRIRINQADRGLKNTTFVWGDVTVKTVPQADVIIQFHLLHHLSSLEKQEELIEQCYKKLSPQGKLIIVEVAPKFSVKYLIAWFTDHFLVPWVFEKRFYSSIYFRKIDEWGKLLDATGFKYRVITAEKGKPFTNVIFECHKKN